MAKTLTDITPLLEEPFAIQDIDLLPKGQVERDGKILCMALPYADPRVYQDRLNKVVPGEWSTPPPIALAVGQKIVVYVTVTICGISHTDVGEASATSENAATESYAQGFKRACAQFGLGRYLYSLEKAWVPYNKQRKQIDLDAAGIQRTVQQMYAKAHIGTPARDAGGNSEQTETTRNAPAPGVRDLYKIGFDKGLWANTAGFCAFASAELGFNVSSDSKMSQEQRIQLNQAIEEEEPVKKAS